ncbi:MAG TPA: hypothetical protein VEC37_06230, partial [Bacillota bacterium]|nr:hypothetical protein [Bacillota bacterium]
MSGKSGRRFKEIKTWGPDFFLPEDTLDYLSKEYIFIPATCTVKEAFQKLTSAGGNIHWFLVVELPGGGHYFYTTYMELRIWDRSEKPAGRASLATTSAGQSSPASGTSRQEQRRSIRIAELLADPSQKIFQPLPVVEESDSAKAMRLTKYLDGQGAALLCWQDSGETCGLFVRPSQFKILSDRLREVIAKTTSVWAVLVFVLTVLLPTYFLFKDDIYPMFIPPRMNGEWNIAVAPFQIVGDTRISQQNLDLVNEVFYNRLSKEMENLANETNLVVQLLEPKQTGRVNESSAQKRAEEINADIVVYGLVEQRSGSLFLTPRFYVNSRSIPVNYHVGSGGVTDLEILEITGEHSLGGGINLGVDSVDMPTQLKLNRELTH